MRDLPAALAAALRSLLQRAGAGARALVRQRRLLALAAAVGAFALVAIVTIPPPPGTSNAAELEQYIEQNAQSLEVAADAAAPEPEAPNVYTATPGIQTLAASGTNHDWAKMVMLFGGWPMSDENITVVTRWMRQENYTDSWWNRNNPLNNGWGTQGGTFMSGYTDLVDAARNAAEALHSRPAYAEIVAAFERSAPTAETEKAIWYSGWATGMYNDGAHWHYTPVEVVKAPPSAWGL